MSDQLKQLLDNAYAPYSQYRVAAIVVMNDGQTFKGVNIENAVYGATICAERNAINAAISNGYKKGTFSELHVMVDSDKAAYPCFVCRQTICEFCDSTLKIAIYNNKGEKTDVLYNDIIVKPFTESDMQ